MCLDNDVEVGGDENTRRCAEKFAERVDARDKKGAMVYFRGLPHDVQRFIQNTPPYSSYHKAARMQF